MNIKMLLPTRYLVEFPILKGFQEVVWKRIQAKETYLLGQYTLEDSLYVVWSSDSGRNT